MSSICQQMENFLYREPIPEYGYTLNACEGIGSQMMVGARIAHAKRTEALKNETIVLRIIGIIEALAYEILFSPLTLIGTTLRGIGALFPHQFTEVTDSVFPRTESQIIDQLYTLIQAFSQAAQKHNLTFWATGGTLLGANRNKGIIPWDDDADFAMLAEQLPLLETIQKELATQGILLQEGDMNVWKLSFTQEEKVKRFNTDAHAHVDICLFMPDKEGLLIPPNTLYRNLFPKEYFTQAEIAGLITVPFGPLDKNLSIPILQASNDYLHRTYGEDCFEYGLKTHDHSSFFGFLKIGNWNPNFSLQKVKIEDTNPARGIEWN